MADKSFGVKELNLLNASGTPTVTSPNNLNLNANTVAISTSATVGNNLTVSGQINVGSNIKIGNAGVVTATSFVGSGANLTGISAGISTDPSNVQATWKLGGGSGSGFTFTGPGQDGSEGNPDIYLVRGQRYLFDNTALAGSHPFEFRNAANNADYTDGVSGAQNGLQYINVQHDAPALLKYRCTIHTGSMLGDIYIIGGPEVISGVVTATTFSGSGASLTNLPAANLTGTLPAISGANLTSLPSQVTISSNADNRVITGGSGTNLVGEANLTFNGTGELLLTGTNHVTQIMRAGGSTSDLQIQFKDSSGNIESAIFCASDQGDLRFQTGGSNERLRIDSAGRVLIGGTSAIIGSSSEFNEIVLTGKTRGAGITLQDVDANTRFQIRTDDNGDGTLLNASTNHPITIRTNNTERLRIGSSGQIGLSGANYGSSGQVLTSGGSASAVSWSTPMSVLISSTTVSSQVSSVTFTEALTGAFGTYGIYVVTINGMRLANDDRDLRLRYRTGSGGSSQQATNVYLSMTSGADSADSSFSANSFWRLNYNNIGNDIDGSYLKETFNAIFYFYGFEANKRLRYHGQSTYQSSDGAVRGQFVNGYATDGTEVTGLEFFSSSGNIALGKFSLFGVNG